MTLLHILAQLHPLVLPVAAVALLTLLAAGVLWLLCRRAWVSDKPFRLLGLFFGLTGRGILRLACAWVKLLSVGVYVAAFQGLEPLHYSMVLLPGLICALADRPSGWAEQLFWLSLQSGGLVAVNLLCRFIRNMNGGSIYVLIYTAMGIFLCLFSVYLFLNELTTISRHRKIDPEKTWPAE